VNVSRKSPQRGIALLTVLLATALLLVLVAALVDLGTVQLQRSTADLRSLQALAGADAGTAWVRATIDEQQGDVDATIEHLAKTRGKRRFPIDDRSYVVVSVTLIAASQSSGGDHTDDNLEDNPNVVETPVQVESSATVFTDGSEVAHRSTTTLVRVFPAAPFSAVVGFIDDGGPVGIDSPGDAGGQLSTTDATELLVHAYVVEPDGQHQDEDDLSSEYWSDGNTQGPGPLP
jgi:hypothetical protein